MNYRILIIDDELNTRRGEYENFRTAIEKNDGRMRLEFKYLETFSDIFNENYPFAEYDGIISDVILRNDKNVGYHEADIQKLFARIKGIPIYVLLVSSQWDQTTAWDMRSAMESRQCLGHIRYKFIKEIGVCKNRDELNHLAYQLTMLLNADPLPKFDALGANDAISILHISDIQVSADSPQNLDYDLTDVALQYQKHFEKQNPHFVCVTGDISEHGYPSEFAVAAEKLAELGSLTGNPVIFGVPGNHDICLPFCACPRLDLQEKPGTNPKEYEIVFKDNSCREKLPLQAYALKPYLEFAKKALYASRRSRRYEPYLDTNAKRSDYFWIEDRFAYLGLLFYGINTANHFQDHADTGTLSLGPVMNKAAKELRAILDKHQQQMTVIGCYHHNPFDVKYYDQHTILKEFEREFYKSPANIILYGHEHANFYNSNSSHPDAKVHLCGASTYTKAEKSRPADSNRGFTVVNINRQNSIPESITVTSIIYSAGKWQRLEPRTENLR